MRCALFGAIARAAPVRRGFAVGARLRWLVGAALARAGAADRRARSGRPASSRGRPGLSPARRRGSTSCSLAMRRAVGVARGVARPALAAAACAAGVARRRRGGLRAARTVPPAARRWPRRAARFRRSTASSSPILTSSPSCRLMLASTPPWSALTSRSIFSVSSSTTGSPSRRGRLPSSASARRAPRRPIHRVRGTTMLDMT